MSHYPIVPLLAGLLAIGVYPIILSAWLFVRFVTRRK